MIVVLIALVVVSIVYNVIQVSVLTTKQVDGSYTITISHNISECKHNHNRVCTN